MHHPHTGPLAVILLAALAMTACSSAMLPKGDVVPPGFLPPGVTTVELTMPLSSFEGLDGKSVTKPDNPFSHRIVLEETPKGGDVAKITYYFEPKGSKRLYEVIVEYEAGVDVPKIVQARYGTPNDGEEWIFPSGKGYDVKVWTFDQTIVVAAALPGTEVD